MKRVMVIFSHFFLMSGVSAIAQTIRGTVIDLASGQPMSFTSIQLVRGGIKGDYQLTDAKGEFVFRNLNEGIYAIRVLPVAKKDTLFSNFKIPGDSVIRLSYIIYCQYDKAKNDKTCPVCKKSDKVIPISYGLPVYDPHKKESDNVETYNAGCEVTYCDPHWYCKRNKVSF